MWRAPHDRPLPTEGSGLVNAPKRSEKAHEAKEEEDLLKAAEKIADSMGVITETTYVSELSPYEAIIKTAENSKCDLIVMASHGRRGIAGVVMGSETHKVLTHTTIPVLV